MRVVMSDIRTKLPVEADEAGWELEVEAPGGPHAVYQHSDTRASLRLAAVHYPPERRPADLCAVTRTLADEAGAGAPLAALLLGNVSHPAGCRVEARLLGLLRAGSEPHGPAYLIAVAAADPHFAEAADVEALAPLRRRSLEAFVRAADGPGMTITWGGRDEALALALAGRQRYRRARAEQPEEDALAPAWKPAWVREAPDDAARREAERHTAAEYGFHRLPYRFQQYVEVALTADERILLSLPRPRMQAHQPRAFLRRQRLEEGVLVITDRQAAQVTELMPPDSAGIRYGFVDRVGALERLAGVEVVAWPGAAIGLALTWAARGGCERLVWEFPASQRGLLEQAAALLSRWLPQPGSRHVRRATPPSPPEAYPPLRDPGANSPDEVRPLAERLEAALAEALMTGEVVLARCLLPAWVEDRGRARLVAVTTQRCMVIADPVGAGTTLDVNLAVAAIASLEYSNTLVGSHLTLMTPADGRVSATTIRFTATLAAMDDCYHALRRLLGVVPIEAVGKAGG